MIAAGLTLAAGLAFAAEPSAAPSASAVGERQEILAELRERGILPPAADSWGPREEALLARMRRAEARGALDVLREEAPALRGLAVSHRSGLRKIPRLTKAGFEKYVFFQSQRARKYFEDQGADAKDIFRLRSLDGRRLFDRKGILTPEGEELYDRVLEGRMALWKDPWGKTQGGPPAGGGASDSGEAP